MGALVFFLIAGSITFYIANYFATGRTANRFMAQEIYPDATQISLDKLGAGCGFFAIIFGPVCLILALVAGYFDLF